MTNIIPAIHDPQRLPFMIEYLMAMNRDPLYVGLAWDITINNSGAWNQPPVTCYYPGYSWGVITNLTIPEKYG